MSVAYTKANSDEVIASVTNSANYRRGEATWSVEEGRNIPCSGLRVSVALSDMHEFGPIFSEPGVHNYPDSFDDVRALCRWVIRSGGKVVIPTIK